MLSVTPTMPSPPSARHSSIARESARLRTPYRFLSSTLNGPLSAEARSVLDVYEPMPEHFPPRLA
jgi:hypothetical protein